MLRLVLGSRNKKKLREIVELLGDLGLDLADLSAYPNAPEVEETADTFVGNATLKATQLAPVLGAWVIGEDSGSYPKPPLPRSSSTMTPWHRPSTAAITLPLGSASTAVLT